MNWSSCRDFIYNSVL